MPEQKPTKLKNNIKKQDQNKDWENKIQEAKNKKEQEMTNPPVEEPVKTVQNPVEEKKPEVKQNDPNKFESYFNDEAGQHHVDNPPYIPTEEEKQREENYFRNNDGDASSLLHEIIGCDDDITAASKLVKEVSDANKGATAESNPELKDLFEWAGQLRAALGDNETFGNQKRLLLSMIDALNRHDVMLEKLDRQLSISKITTDLTGKPKIYKGNEAIQLINNRYRGVYKVQLPNQLLYNHSKQQLNNLPFQNQHQ